MAEIAVSFALDKLRDQLEEGLDRKAGEEALKIDKAIDEMKGFLNDADWKREGNNDVKKWVGKARALAYRVEDQVDSYRTRTGTYRVKLVWPIRFFLLLIYGYFSEVEIPFLLFIPPVIFMVLTSADKILAPLLFRRRLQEIFKEIDAVIKEMEDFNFEYTIKETVSVHDAEAPPLPLAGMVGMVDEAKQAKKWLLESNVQDGVVVFIIGGMGIGKTTLAANVYEETKNHFDCHTWVFLSHPFDKMVTLKEILRGFYESCSESAPSNLEDMREEDLRKAVSSYLTQKKKHLLVLDGVRNSETLTELNLNLLLQHGGKIIVTTTDSTLPRVVITNEEDDAGQVPANESANIIDEDLHRRRSLAAGKLPVVAADIAAGPSNRPSSCWENTETTQPRYVYKIDLKKLPSHESRVLLRSKALPSGREFPRDLETIVEEILQKCEGLPISIVTVGSLLSTKESKPEEWQKVVDLLNSIGKLTSKDIFVSSGYSDLSPVLKQCFLYCGIFPENYRISKKRLIRMWVAEGFVDKIKKKTQEEAAEQQLDELIKRNMLQVAGKDLKGDIQSCRLLNLMSDFARTMSRDDNFCAVVRSPDDHKFDWKELRRLSTEDVAIIRNSQLVTARKLRSLLFFGAITTNLPSSLTQNSTTSTEIISSNLQIPILKLTIHIPYIIRLWCIPTNILFSWIQSVPLTFVMLRVLELHGLRINVLPSEVGDLILLRYLGLRKTGIACLPKSIIRLTELETLDIRQTNVRQMPDLFQLKKLRHLYMEGSFMNRVVSLSQGVMWLPQLQTLAGARITDNLSEQLSCLTGLRKLSLGKAQLKHSVSLCKALSKMTLLQSLNIKCDWGENFSLDYLANSTCQYNLRDHDLENFQHFPHLSKLKLGGCMDSLVNWVSKIHSLAYLYLWDSQLIDDPLCKLKHLNKLLLLSINNAYDGTKMSLEGDGFHSLKKLSIIRLRNLETVSITEGAMLKLEHLFFAQCPKLEEPPACIQHLNDFKTMQVAAMPSGFEEKALEMSSQGNKFRVQHIRQIIIASS